MSRDPEEQFRTIIRKDGRFPEEAFEFLYEGLKFTSHRVYGARKDDSAKHVTGQQLCEGLRDLALHTWGLLASSVLASWNIKSTRDFGEMVFLLVKHGLMGKRDEDLIEDFDDVFPFSSAFGRYEVSLTGTETANETGS